LKNFLLPGGHPTVGFSHICRSICRRAERQIVKLSEEAKIDENIFILARKFMQDFEVEEVIWEK